jgi:hypothetical protein
MTTLTFMPANTPLLISVTESAYAVDKITLQLMVFGKPLLVDNWLQHRYAILRRGHGALSDDTQYALSELLEFRGAAADLTESASIHYAGHRVTPENLGDFLGTSGIWTHLKTLTMSICAQAAYVNCEHGFFPPFVHGLCTPCLSRCALVEALTVNNA